MATFETIKVQMAHVKALDAAQKASREFADRYMGGRDGGPCGFAWVNVFGVRSNSKLGRALSDVGFSKAYGGGLQQWNRWWNGQSVDAAEHGAVEYARVIKEELGLEAYAGSRLD
jgi:hypothetical protein